MTIDERISEHHSQCIKSIDATYLRRPHWMVAPATVFAIVVFVATVIAAYYTDKGQLDNRVTTVETNCQHFESVVIENQRLIISELKELKKGNK